MNGKAGSTAARVHQSVKPCCRKGDPGTTWGVKRAEARAYPAVKILIIPARSWYQLLLVLVRRLKRNIKPSVQKVPSAKDSDGVPLLVNFVSVITLYFFILFLT